MIFDLFFLDLPLFSFFFNDDASFHRKRLDGINQRTKEHFSTHNGIKPNATEPADASSMKIDPLNLVDDPHLFPSAELCGIQNYQP
jgi:hypothetical protein